METAPDPAQVVLDRIADLEVQRARIEAETAVLMLEHADGCRARAERHADPRKRDLEAGFAADQLGVVLHQPTKLVQDRLAQSRRIRSLMPRTWDAYLAGRIDAYRVSLIAAATAKLQDNDQRIELDQGVADYAATHTTAQLKGKLTRFVATRVTDGTAVRNERARRSVWVSHQDDGMSFLTAYIPTTDAIRIDALLTERAKRHSDDGRTFDQRRADELVAQMLGQNIDDKARSSISRAVIGVVVPVATLAGLSDQPGQSIDGSYALPADLIRDLATEPGTLFYRIIKDPLWRILDIA
ncbi:MAG: hypothetical protein JWP31_2408 [Aeromicrobium sp.]|nr:hypothetical protein [Aeromicrobium sp.]